MPHQVLVTWKQLRVYTISYLVLRVFKTYKAMERNSGERREKV
jgi:hypothetical protein